MRSPHINISYLRFPFFLRIIISAITIILLFGFLIHLVEPKTFTSWFDGIWWAIVTTATVGYGDLAPESTIGRIIGIALILFGVGIVTAYFSTLSTTVVSRAVQFQQGYADFTEENHLIIVGWNERTSRVLKSLPATEKVVLIDHSLPEWDVSEHTLHFIRGQASDECILHKANIIHARSILISANRHMSEYEADLSTIVTLLGAKACNPTIYAVVELLTEKQLHNAHYAKADDIIEATNFVGRLMTHSLHINKHTSFEHFFYKMSEKKFHFQPVKFEWIGMSFCDISHLLSIEHHIVLGISHGEEILLNPSPLTILEEMDQLLLME